MRKRWIWIVGILAIIVVGAILVYNHAQTPTEEEAEEQLREIEEELNLAHEASAKHIHGIGYSADGSKILASTHEGIKIFSDGSWSHVGEKHDYTGFSPVDFGFYSSGYPAEGSKLQSPLGIVKSTDEGKTVEEISLGGEADFEGMAAGYFSHTIYTFNPIENSLMSEAGLFYSNDEGKTWSKSEMKGLEEMISSIAVHPSKSEIIAMGSDTGVYVSTDNGNQFNKVVDGIGVTTVYINNKDEMFVTGVQNEKEIVLFKVDLNGKSRTEVKPPKLTVDNPILHLAQNPVQHEEFVFVANNYDVYRTEDNGGEWTRIQQTEE